MLISLLSIKNDWIALKMITWFRIQRGMGVVFVPVYETQSTIIWDKPSFLWNLGHYTQYRISSQNFIARKQRVLILILWLNQAISRSTFPNQWNITRAVLLNFTLNYRLILVLLTFVPHRWRPTSCDNAKCVAILLRRLCDNSATDLSLEKND